jgi:hypothetical protein
VGITYDKNFVKIKTLYYNHLEEHTLLNYETLDATIDRQFLCEWGNIKGMLFEIYYRLIVVLEKIMDKEVIEKVEEQPDLLDLEIEEEIEEIVIGQNTLKKVKILGKPYWKSNNDLLYDLITEEIIGFWDPTTNNIIKANDDDDYDCDIFDC